MDLWFCEAQIQENYYHWINNIPGKPDSWGSLGLTSALCYRLSSVIRVMKKKIFVILQKILS